MNNTNMTYELAKELKDAGWPQDKLTLLRHHKYIGLDGIRYSDNLRHLDIALRVPTLEELIEAVGDCQLEVRKDRSIVYDPTENFVGDADTPTEAVARLWLALNKK